MQKITKERDYNFPVIIEQDEDGFYVVTNPSIEGCYSQGKTMNEALKNIKEATELCLEIMQEEKIKPRIKKVSMRLISLEKQNA